MAAPFFLSRLRTSLSQRETIPMRFDSLYPQSRTPRGKCALRGEIFPRTALGCGMSEPWSRGIQRNDANHRMLQRLARLWWAALVVLGLVALVLGIWGYRHTRRENGPSWSGWDLLYLNLQLFTLNFGAHQRHGAGSLDVVRFLAAFVAFSTIITTVVQIFDDRLQLFRLKIIHNHVILCGLGRRGTRLVEDECASGVIASLSSRPTRGTKV